MFEGPKFNLELAPSPDGLIINPQSNVSNISLMESNVTSEATNKFRLASLYDSTYFISLNNITGLATVLKITHDYVEQCGKQLKVKVGLNDIKVEDNLLIIVNFSIQEIDIYDIKRAENFNIPIISIKCGMQ